MCKAPQVCVEVKQCFYQCVLLSAVLLLTCLLVCSMPVLPSAEYLPDAVLMPFLVPCHSKPFASTLCVYPVFFEQALMEPSVWPSRLCS